MAVANPVTMAPMQVAVADQAAMAVVMPMAMAVMHLYEQVALGHCGFGNGGLRRDGCRGGRSEQGAIPTTAAAKVIFVSMILLSLGWRSSGVLIRAIVPSRP